MLRAVNIIHKYCMRICLLGLPRSGSQYIAELICRCHRDSVTDCQEPFTESLELEAIENKNGNIVRTKNKNFASLDDQCTHMINVINSTNSTQNLLLRLFLLDNIEPFLPTIITELKKNNFQFLAIKRENIENQLLSYGIAQTTQQWNTFNSTPYNNGQKYTIKNLGSMQWLYDQIKKYESRLALLECDYEIIRYEHAPADLLKILEIPIYRRSRLQKQIIGDPYDIIENSDEVKDFLKKIVN